MWPELIGAGVGALGGLLGGGSKEQSSQGQINLANRTPSPYGMPYLGFMNQMLSQLMQTPTPFFPGQTYTGPSGPMQQGLNMQVDAAGRMQPYLDTMQKNYGFLSNAADVANNPYVQSMNQTMQQQVNQNLQRNLLPQLQSGAMNVNALGSDRLGLAQGQAIGDTSQALANQISQNNLTAYGQGLGAQQNALAQTGNVLTNTLAPAQVMQQAGRGVEYYQNQALQDAMSRFGHQYSEPWMRLQRMASFMPNWTAYDSNMSMGTQGQPAQGGGNPFMNALGGGMAGWDFGKQIGGLF